MPLRAPSCFYVGFLVRSLHRLLDKWHSQYVLPPLAQAEVGRVIREELAHQRIVLPEFQRDFEFLLYVVSLCRTRSTTHVTLIELNTGPGFVP